MIFLCDATGSGAVSAPRREGTYLTLVVASV